MAVRQTLNRIYLYGALALASVLGLLAGSWTVFIVSAVIVLLTSLSVGDIRLRHRNGRDDD